MPATVAGAFLDALVPALSGIPALAGVAVYGCPVAPEDLGAEGIELAEEFDIKQDNAAMGSNNVEETFTIKGSIFVARPYKASGSQVATINAAAKAARDRCFAILGAVSKYLANNPTVGGVVRWSELSSLNVKQGMAPEPQLGRACYVEFQIDVEQETDPDS